MTSIIFQYWMLGELHANIEMFLFSVLEKQGKEKGCHVAGWVSYSATIVFKFICRAFTYR